MTAKTVLFTPRIADGTRLSMQISAAEHVQIRRGRRWHGKFTDLDTGRQYAAHGAACEIPGCFCDAVAVETIKKGIQP